LPPFTKDRMMKRIVLWTATWLACNAIATEPSLPPRVTQAIQDRVAAGQNPTIVVAMVDGDQSHIYTFGKLDSGAAPNAKTIYEIGSVTKTFTATLLAQAVTQGQLKLDQPLSSLLPGYTIPSKDGHVITLANVAEQNSGLPRLPTNMKPADPSDPYVDYDPGKLKAFLASYTLTRDPGALYEYSNLAVGLLGYALGQHAGSDYATLLTTTILQPLGMKDTSVAMGKGDVAGMAGGHDDEGKPIPSWHFDALAAAGGIRSTGEDMLRYLQANMGQNPSSLWPAMQLAHTPRPTVRVTPNNQIGLIWMTQHTGHGPDVIWHNGETGGYASFIGFTADRQHGVVILTNADIGVEDLGFALFDPTSPIQPAHKRMTLPPEALDAYTGVYLLSPHMALRITRADDHLMAQATRQPSFPVYPSATNEFFAHIANISMSFQRDGSGQVTGLVLHQQGDHAAPRITEDAAAKAENMAEVNLPDATLQEYVGNYTLSPAAAFVVTDEHDQLMVKLASQPSFPVYAKARDHFFYRVVDAQIDFERDASGKVIALILHQNGNDLRAAKASAP
jgi:serine-type D-Ala-D-Ala carboxypeptidase/endopeptidase